MKLFKYKIFAFLFLLLTKEAYTQAPPHYNYKVQYKVTSQNDSTNENSRKTEFTTLYTGLNHSLFIPELVLRVDSILMSPDDNPEVMIAFHKNNSVGKEWFVVKNEDRIISYECVNGFVHQQNLKCSQNKKLFDWQILNDTMSIGGILCQKAETFFGNRYWQAWFAPSIPIPDGPYKFSGLPGLILKVNDVQHYWNFDFISFAKKDTGFYLYAITKSSREWREFKFYKDLLKWKRYILDNKYEMNLSTGKIRYADEQARIEDKKRSKQRARENNNWIELYKP